jgi:WD40 repeat protein
VGLWCVAYSHDGTRLATSRRDGLVEVFDTSVNPQWTLMTKSLPGKAASALAFSPDGRRLAVGRAGAKPTEGRVQIWDVSPLRPTVLLERRGTRTRAVCFSDDGNELAVGSDGKVDILSVETAKPRLQIRFAPEHEAAQVAFDHRGSLLVAEGLPATRLWTTHVYNVKDGAEIKTIGDAFNSKESFAVSAAGDLLTTCKDGDPPQVALYELPTGRLRTKAIGRRVATGHEAFAPSGTMLALAAKGGVELWDTRDAHEIGFLSGMGPDNGPLAFSPDGRLLFVVSLNQNSVHLWDVEQRTQLFTLRLPLELTARTFEWLLAVSPDGKKIAYSVRNPSGTGGVYLFSGLPSGPN